MGTDCTEKTGMRGYRLVGILVTIVFLAVACNPEMNNVATDLRTMQVGQAIIEVEVADTVSKRAQGLSGRKYMDQNHGMIFIFEEPSKYTFWMKDTLIPLDFIWIANGKVVEITNNVDIELGKRDTELSRYTPINPVDSMIEMNAGWVEKNNIKVGDSVVFLAPGNRP